LSRGTVPSVVPFLSRSERLKESSLLRTPASLSIALLLSTELFLGRTVRVIFEVVEPPPVLGAIEQTSAAAPVIFQRAALNQR
jgi:hypothetical protein